jgi:drug/metabolite transporter (DMT)-like permease
MLEGFGMCLAVPIGIIYNLVISKLGNMITKDSIYQERIQKNVLIEIIGSILAFTLAILVFDKSKFQNKIVKTGLMFGGSLLLFYSLICSWDTIEDITKLVAMIGVMILVIIYSYKCINKNSDKKKD